MQPLYYILNQKNDNVFKDDSWVKSMKNSINFKGIKFGLYQKDQKTAQSLGPDESIQTR